MNRLLHRSEMKLIIIVIYRVKPYCSIRAAVTNSTCYSHFSLSLDPRPILEYRNYALLLLTVNTRTNWFANPDPRNVASLAVHRSKRVSATERNHVTHSKCYLT